MVKSVKNPPSLTVFLATFFLNYRFQGDFNILTCVMMYKEVIYSLIFDYALLDYGRNPCL